MYLDKKTLRNIFLLALGCILVYWILNSPERFNAIYGTFKGIFSPFIWGAGIAFILNVPMRGIENKWLYKIKSDSAVIIWFPFTRSRQATLSTWWQRGNMSTASAWVVR